MDPVRVPDDRRARPRMIEIRSEFYAGSKVEFYGRTLVQARKFNRGAVYCFAEFYDEADHPPGAIPDGFLDRARLAFAEIEQR